MSVDNKVLRHQQAAIEALMLVADLDGPTMFARIGVMRALNRTVERVFNPDCKNHHWGKRKAQKRQVNTS